MFSNFLETFWLILGTIQGLSGFKSWITTLFLQENTNLGQGKIICIDLPDVLILALLIFVYSHRAEISNKFGLAKSVTKNQY